MSMRMTRRGFLRAGAGSVLGLPLLASPRAWGQAQYPRRLVVFFTPNGVNPETWFPAAGSTEHDWTLGPVLAPLRRFQQQLIVTSGLDLASAAVGPGEQHQQGMGSVLTGSHLQPGAFVGGDGTLAGWGDGISIDQAIAQQIGQSTRLRSLELGVRVTGSEVRHRISYAGAANPLPPIEIPRVAHTLLFSELDPTDPALAARLRARRSVLDAVHQQFAAVRQRVSAADRQKLDAHAHLVRDLERRLGAEVIASCQAPPVPALFNPSDENNMARSAALMVDLSVAALACDQTRVITLQMSSGANNIRFPHLNSGQDDHQLSHAGPNDAAARSEWVRRKIWYSEQFARLLGGLEAVPEGDGTLLDHTLVLWCSELAQGNTHSHANMPFLMAGGGAGWSMGRYLQFDSRPHNDLLLSMAQAFGVGGNTFGDPVFNTGPIESLFI